MADEMQSVPEVEPVWVYPPILPSDLSDCEEPFDHESPRCCYCAVTLSPNNRQLGICRGHIKIGELPSDWSTENRIYCDFLHGRIKELPRVSEPDRISDAELFLDRYTEIEDEEIVVLPPTTIHNSDILKSRL